MTQTRRLAAIVAIDVVGYSRLMGEDEARTAREVREHREAVIPIIAEFGGRILKTTGDGLLLEFSSVVAAIKCAIAIQKLMVERNAGVPESKRIVCRVGVNLGDVLIEGDDILGDGVKYRGAAGEHSRARRRFCFGRRLRPCPWPGRRPLRRPELAAAIWARSARAAGRARANGRGEGEANRLPCRRSCAMITVPRGSGLFSGLLASERPERFLSVLILWFGRVGRGPLKQ